MAPPFFQDFNKPINDLLEDDYGLKKTFKVKHTTPHGVGFTVENEHKKGAVGGKISVKYAHASSGFALDKFTLKPDGGHVVECSLKGMAPGLKLTAKVDDAFQGTVGGEYTGKAYAFKTDVNVELSNITASGAIAYEGAVVGGAVSCLVPGEKPAALKDYNAGMTYGSKAWLAALTTSNKFATYNLSTSYNINPKATAAMVASFTPEKSTQAVALGFKWLVQPKTVLRAKANSDGILSAALTYACAPLMSVGLASQTNVKDLRPKFGITCSLG